MPRIEIELLEYIIYHQKRFKEVMDKAYQTEIINTTKHKHYNAVNNTKYENNIYVKDYKGCT